MRVTISVFARYHAFYLAQQLQAYGYLQRLITTYPAFEVRKYGIDQSRIRSLVAHEAISRALRSTSRIFGKEPDLPYFLHESFDRAASRSIPPGCDIFVGWSSLSERAMYRAKELGAVAVLERGSSHIEHQRAILRKEYEQHGQRIRFADPRVVEKELREYQLADYICVPSAFARQSFLTYGIPTSKLIQVPYGVDLTQFQPLPKRDTTFRVI
jgi:glycosyltransferase involved in cell wall biosynthesis